MPNTPVQVRFPEDELNALDSYRREQRNPPSRAQAIRELMRAGLMNGEVTRSDSRSRAGERGAI
jgi:metal-responsive CopG/Arc/MetJ family transcriptional regulator